MSTIIETEHNTRSRIHKELAHIIFLEQAIHQEHIHILQTWTSVIYEKSWLYT
jgi:hypothetical protein